MLPASEDRENQPTSDVESLRGMRAGASNHSCVT